MSAETLKSIERSLERLAAVRLALASIRTDCYAELSATSFMLDAYVGASNVLIAVAGIVKALDAAQIQIELKAKTATKEE